MKKIYIKIISLVFVFLFILFTPIGSFIQGENAKAYALEATLEEAVLKYLFPVAAYMTWQHNQTMKGIENAVANVTELNNQISQIAKYQTELISTIPDTAKAIVAYLYTELTADDINTALGTTYTPEQLLTMSAPYQTKLDNGTLGLTYDDIFGLGISNLFANSVKLLNNHGFDTNVDLPTTPFGNLYFKSIKLSNGHYYSIQTNSFNREFWNLFDVPVYVSSQLGLYSFNCVKNTSLYQFGNIRLYTYGFTPTIYPEDSSSYNLELYPSRSIISNFFSTRSYSSGTPNKIVMQYFYNDGWHTVKTYGNSGSNELLTTTADLLDDILTFTGADYTSSVFYTSPLFMYDVMNLTFDGEIVLNSEGLSSFPLSIPAVGSGFFAPDTTESNAERLITATGTTSNIYDLEIGTNTVVNDDPDTNTSNPVISEIVVAPTDTSTYPDSSVDTSNPDSGTIPDTNTDGNILDSLMDWLASLINALKAMFISLFVPSPTFFTEYFNRVSTFVGDKLGIFGFPLEVLYMFVNSYLDIPDAGDVVINVPALNVNILGDTFTLFPAYTFDFNSIFNLSGFGTIRAIYLTVVDCIVIFGLLYLLYVKGNEVLKN